MTDSTPRTIGEAATDDGRAIGDDIALQLASVAYCKDIPGTLKQVLPRWDAVWLPQRSIGGNLAFIAFNGVQYVVAIRGSVLSFSWGAFDDWFEQDLDVFVQTDWLYPPDPQTKPKISAGSARGLRNLNELVNAGGQTMWEFLRENCVKQGKLLGVTGHSLGANLATVYAPWLLYQIKQCKLPVPPLFSVLTFAAPTAGNKAFADQYDAAFTNTWRYYNELDVVPRASNDVASVGDLFPSPAPAAKDISVTVDGHTITLKEAIEAVAVSIAVSEAANGFSYYTHTNQDRGSIELNSSGKIFPVSSTDPLEAWFEQVAAQHAHNHYLDFLGAANVNCDTSADDVDFTGD